MEIAAARSNPAPGKGVRAGRAAFRPNALRRRREVLVTDASIQIVRRLVAAARRRIREVIVGFAHARVVGWWRNLALSSG
jgi:hypothetical protein